MVDKMLKMYRKSSWICRLALLGLWLFGLWGSADAAKPVGTRLVFGLGPGLVAVIVLAVVCVLICAVGYSAQNKSHFVIPVIVIVGGTTLFFASVNIDSDVDTARKTTVYNRVAITRSAIATIMIAFTVISGFTLLIMHVVTPRQGHLIGDGAGRRSGQARVF